MKTTLLLSLIIVLTSSSLATAQNDCNLAADTSMIFNLKLGMSPEEVNSRFGRDLKVKVKKKGEGTFFQNFIKKPTPQSLNGVRAIYLRFLNRKLYQIEIFYQNQARWLSLTDFTRDLSANLNLPVTAWENIKNREVLNCSQITFIADNVLNPRIEITDPVILAEVEKQRLAEKD